jgi:hypothetical protein
MRWLLISILLQCFPAIGAERVSIATPVVTLVNDAKLHELCGADGPFDACTRFAGLRLDAGCSFDGRAWRLDTSATIRPYIVLRNLHSLPHEYLHIGDVRSAVETMVRTLTSAAFASEPQCRQRALSESASFEAALRAIAHASNLARHPQLATSR